MGFATLLIFSWFVSGLLAAALLSGSNRAGTGCLLGALLGPLGVVIAAIMRQEKPTAPVVAAEPSKRCPECAETVLQAAKKCRFCGHLFVPANGV